MMARIAVSYNNLSERFSKTNKEFDNQYCSLYTVRLNQMRQHLKDRIKRKWGDEYPVCELHKLAEKSYDKCVVIGTLFKDQKLKPSVLKQIAEANQFIPQPVGAQCTSESDVLYIEDELQRYLLIGPLKCDDIVTGITCAILGTDTGKGKLMVADYCFANCRPQIERPFLDDSVYVVFISGLDLLHIEKSQLQLQLFINWLSGIVGVINDVDNRKIARLVIAGNSVRNSIKKLMAVITLTSRKEESDEIIRAVKMLDTFLTYLCSFINVDIMPGENDPSNHVLPQKPMHHCLFANSYQYKSLNRVSNPYECEIKGVRLLGTSGQPLNNIKQFSEIEESIDVLGKCLLWNHLAPTAPDTLGCFPFYDCDPFILEDCPHVLFAGNQDKFDTQIYKGPEKQQVRLICVPQFSTTYTACILNLKNLDCFPMKFESDQ